MKIRFTQPRTVTAGEEYDSDLYEFDIKKDLKPVNYLICLGRGELRNRQKYNLYLDEVGNITDHRVFYGKDTVKAVYDYSSAESFDELKKAGLKHYKELLDSGTRLEITPPDKEIFNIGDTIAGREQKSGIYVEKTVKKIIYKAQDDSPPTITYETTETKRG